MSDKPTQDDFRRIRDAFEDAQDAVEALAKAGLDTSDAWVDALAAWDAYHAALRARAQSAGAEMDRPATNLLWSS